VESLQDNSPHPVNSEFTSIEINNCLQDLKSKAMGPDLIHNRMLKNLNNTNRMALTHLINTLFISGFVPEVWKSATVIPLLKPGKDPSKTDSYRPISLTSCLAKIMEKAINNRLIWFLDNKNLLPKFQTGFRRHCSTLDNIMHLESHIKLAFSKAKMCTSVFLDLANAYPSTWIPGLSYKLTKMDIKGTMLRWLTNFLNNRTLRVRVGTALSDERTILKGVPQGCVLSPLLFNVMMSDFPRPPAGVHLGLFADDIEMHAISKSKNEAALLLQPYLHDIEDWVEEWRFSLSIGKCAALTFSRKRTHLPHLNLKLMGSSIIEVKHFKFLGLIFDSKLSWDKHIEEINTCLIRRGNILKSLTSKKTYLSTTLLLRVYKALIRSKLDYGAAALVNIPKSKIEILERTQNQLLRIVLGCLKSTPKALLHLETNILPVHMRWQNLAANYYLKLSHKPFNPAYKIIKNLYESNTTWPVRSIPASIPTLKFVDSLDATDLFSLQSSNKVSTHPIPPWKLIKIEGRFFPLNKTQARLQPILAKKLFTEILATEQPNHILVYTDGSVLSNPESVACAVYIPKLKIEKAWKLTKFTNIFNAELAAILQALKILYSQDETVEIVILSDSKSSIQAIINHRWEASPLISEIIQLIYNYSWMQCSITLDT
jgi:hypothetical protein